MPAPAERMVILGLDGGTASLLEAAFQRGWMPNLSSFWKRSATGAIQSTVPMVTPVAWTSFLTGCEPASHGIHEFYRMDNRTGTISPNHAGRVRQPTLWEVMASQGHEVVSLNLPMTYPPPRVAGIVVGGTDAPGVEAAFSHCPAFGEELRARHPDFTHKIVWKARPRTLDELSRRAARSQAAFSALAGAAELADQRCDWTCLLVHFHDLDSLQHRLWPYLEVDDTGISDPRWNGPVVACLKALDSAIGRVMELASRRDAAVIALSDHGFGACRALVDINGLLRRWGLQKGLPYGTRFGYRLHRVADRLRRWRARRDDPAAGSRQPKSTRGQVACDWGKTAAFAPFGQLCASIYLNRAVLGNEAAVRRTMGEVIERCREARDPETGELLFADAFGTADRYGLDPEAEGLPDVLAPSADGFQAQVKWSALDNRWIRPDWNLPGTHYRKGVVAIDGPGVLPGERLEACLPDIAPTALCMLDLSVPHFMEGRVLQEAFDHALQVRRSMEFAGSNPHRLHALEVEAASAVESI